MCMCMQDDLFQWCCSWLCQVGQKQVYTAVNMAVTLRAPEPAPVRTPVNQWLALQHLSNHSQWKRVQPFRTDLLTNNSNLLVCLCGLFLFLGCLVLCSCGFVFLCFVCFWCVVFCLFLRFGDDFVTVHRTTYRSFTSSLLWPLNRRRPMYA